LRTVTEEVVSFHFPNSCRETKADQVQPILLIPYNPIFTASISDLYHEYQLVHSCRDYYFD